MRRTVADWIAGALAVVVLAFGGLIVVKPAVDHWNELYRADPFEMGTTTHTVDRGVSGKSAQRTVTTRKESASFAERVLGNSGLLLLRLTLVALAAFLAAAVLQRAILGNYRLRARLLPEGMAAGEPDLLESPPANREPSGNAASTQNGHGAAPEENGADLASSIGKFVAWRREDLGLSQRELGKRAGISHTVISRLESGQQVPSPKTLERLADAFRTDE
jgi:DNA-binding XRE family transcriptional regulator